MEWNITNSAYKLSSHNLIILKDVLVITTIILVEGTLNLGGKK